MSSVLLNLKVPECSVINNFPIPRTPLTRLYCQSKLWKWCRYEYSILRRCRTSTPFTFAPLVTVHNYWCIWKYCILYLLPTISILNYAAKKLNCEYKKIRSLTTKWYFFEPVWYIIFQVREHDTVATARKLATDEAKIIHIGTGALLIL